MSHNTEHGSALPLTLAIKKKETKKIINNRKLLSICYITWLQIHSVSHTCKNELFSTLPLTFAIKKKKSIKTVGSLSHTCSNLWAIPTFLTQP